MESLVCSLIPAPNYVRAPLIRPDEAEMSIKMFMLHRRECYPGSSAVGGPDTRVTLASTITIQLNTELHPNIIYTYNTYMLCYGVVVADADIVTACTTPA